MSFDSLEINGKRSTELDSQDKSYKNLEIERSTKKNKYFRLIAVIFITILFLCLLSFFIFFVIYTVKKNRKPHEENNPKTEHEFVYINDIHLDPLYISDSSPSNCRSSSGSGVQYPFGQYGCDSPSSTFLSMINFLPKACSNPKFVLYGGDGPAHQLGYDLNQVRNLLTWIVQNISSVYPKVPILFALGNNEYVPNYGQNNFEGDSDNFKSISTVLQPYMNDLQRSTFEKGGYYYQDFPEMNLRLVVLNSIIYNTYREIRDDPYGQFEWLRNISIDSRSKGYRLGVSLHISPGVTYNTGSKLNQGWHEEYMQKFDQIVKEFDIQFVTAGHSHYDLIVPLYMPKGVSGGFSLSAPAISAQHRNNPGFRVMKVADGRMTDYVQYYADIMMNPQKELKWEVEYKFTEAYNVENVGTASLQKVVNWVKTTGVGMWRYMEKICSLASDNGKFYYCVLTCTTEDEIKKCMGPMNSKNLLSKYFPYEGRR